MTNYFEELNKKGIKEIEITPVELASLLKEGKITFDQYTRILHENIGTEEFARCLSVGLKEYFKDFSFNESETEEFKRFKNLFSAPSFPAQSFKIGPKAKPQSSS